MNLCIAITLHGYEMIGMLVHFHLHNLNNQGDYSISNLCDANFNCDDFK
jgi:hypothetical protein